MLTLRKLRVATGDIPAANRIAGYVLAHSDSPSAFITLSPPGVDAPGGDAIPSSVWSGSAAMLEALAVTGDATVKLAELAAALQGCRTDDGCRLRKEGMIEVPLLDERGRPVLDSRGWGRKQKVKGTKTVDLTFSAPKSVSVLWSQASPDLRTAIERSMLTAARAMVDHLTATKPVISHRREMQPAVGFAAALALHAAARTAIGHAVPAPQLHVHTVLLGVQRRDGLFASPELSGLFKHGAPLEGGAIARASLAEQLVNLGFSVDPDTGRQHRFFEIHGVPQGLITRMSPRTEDVVAKVNERESVRERPLSGRERAVAAMQTRAPKRALPPEKIDATWRSQAAEFDFTADAVHALRSGFSPCSLSADDSRTRATAAAMGKLKSGVAGSNGAGRAAVLESAAGRLRLADALQLVAELEAAGIISAAA